MNTSVIRTRERFLALPTEVISLVLSYLPRQSLLVTALINRRFQIESDFHLYRDITLKSPRQFQSYRKAVSGNDFRRLRLASFHAEGKGLEHVIQLLLGDPMSEAAFENLTDLTYLPAAPAVAPFYALILAYQRNPSIKLPQLRRLVCDCDVDGSFFEVLKTQPTITSLNVVSDYAFFPPLSRGRKREADVLPNLEELACRMTDFAQLAKPRPIKRVEIIGAIEPAILLQSVVPRLITFTSPTISLKLSLMYTRQKMFAELAPMLNSSSGPTLEELELYDDLGDALFPLAIYGLEHDEEEERTIENPLPTTSSLTRLLAPLASLHHLKRFSYDFPHLGGMYPDAQLDMDKIFYWKDQSGSSLLSAVVGGFAMTRASLDEPWVFSRRERPASLF